jgi:hypothetical protein
MSDYDQNMWQEVLDTYKCILSCRKNMPGMRLEDALNSSAFNSMKSEYTWLQGKAKSEGVEERIRKQE